jgi:RNA polymerase sigma-70 factor (ECF subfamily)
LRHILKKVYPDDPDARKSDVTGATTLAAAAPVTASAPPVPSAVDREEQTIIARCLAGDADAFRPLVQRYQRLVFSVALRMLGGRAEAEDVAQQAFVDAFDALERFRAEGRAHAFSTWLVRIAVNRAKDVLKSKRWSEEPLDREVGGGEASFAHEPPTPEAHALREEQVRRLERALQRVPIKYREVLILKDVEELPYDEIHAILRLPITTLKIRVVRGRVMMQKALDQLDREGRR